jgi:hypothetical protein
MNCYWILPVIGVVILIIGIVATVVVKIDPIPKWRTLAKVLIWIIGLVIFRLIVWSWYKTNIEGKLHMPVESTKKIESIEVKTTQRPVTNLNITQRKLPIRFSTRRIRGKFPRRK